MLRGSKELRNINIPGIPKLIDRCQVAWSLNDCLSQGASFSEIAKRVLDLAMLLSIGLLSALQCSHLAWRFKL